MNRAGRKETLHYHEALYKNHTLFEPGSWLSRPANYILDAAALCVYQSGSSILDLGAGVGRHSVPLLSKFQHGLLPSTSSHMQLID